MRPRWLNHKLIKKINPSQKKIISLGFIVVAAFLTFLFLVYLPNKNAVTKIKLELSAVENQIKEIEAILGGARTIDEGVKLLQERYEGLNNKFPEKEEDSLKALSDVARKLNIELISIKPQPKKIFLKNKSQKIEIEGKTCESVSVFIEMRCSYKDLVKYIQTLKGSSLALITIERLIIKQDKSGVSKLNVILYLNLYLLS